MKAKRQSFRPAALVAAMAVAALQMCAPGAAQNLPGGTSQSIPVGDAPVVRVDLQSATRLIIKTSERRSVEIESTGVVVSQHFNAQQVGAALRPQIDIFAATVQGRMGQITLLPENFVLPPLRGGQHDGVEIRGADTGEVTITIPGSTALLIAHLERGRMVLRDYHEGIFISRVHNGSLMLNADSGAGFAEVARGLLVAQQSSFGRLRARTAVGNLLFEHCSARQIEVTSVLGNIVYDNGSFSSGLARFESLYGNVALGIGTGGVQIGAHSAAGRIYSSLDGRARVSGSGSDVQAQVNGGGPVVTASSGSGAVYLYGGSLRRERTMGNGWGVMRSIMSRRHPGPVKARTFAAPQHRV